VTDVAKCIHEDWVIGKLSGFITRVPESATGENVGLVVPLTTLSQLKRLHVVELEDDCE
jgi:hypothetical protein